MRNVCAAGLAIWAVTVGTAAAQQRPLVTEDPETVGLGLILLEAGYDVQRDVFYPASGLQGNLLRAPLVGLSFGVGPIAEVQIDGGFYNRLSITSRRTAPLSSLMDFSGDRTKDIEDVVVATKIRLVPEGPGRPAIGMRLATKLPNAGNESGLGLDTQDFYATLLVGKTVRSVRLVANVGLGILPDATVGHRQNDVLTYGFSVARAIRQGLEVVGEVNGRSNRLDEDETPPGTESRATMRAGARLTRGTIRIDGGVLVGMTSRDPSIGFTAGLTWVFRGFSTP